MKSSATAMTVKSTAPAPEETKKESQKKTPRRRYDYEEPPEDPSPVRGRILRDPQAE